MAAKKRSKNRNRMADGRLWDDAGLEWLLFEHAVARDRAEELLGRLGRVGVHDDFGRPIRWLSGVAAMEFWRSQAAPRFLCGDDDWGGVNHGPGRCPWWADVYRRGGDELLVLAHD